MILLMAIVAFFHVLINASFDPLIDYLPITLASQSELTHGPFIRSMSTNDSEVKLKPASDRQQPYMVNLKATTSKVSFGSEYSRIYYSHSFLCL
jgi:hypothetical protein